MQLFKSSTDAQTLSHYWQASLRYKKDVIKSICIVLYSISSNTVGPFIVGTILARLLVPGSSLTAYVIAFLANAVFGYAANYIGFQGFMTAQAKTYRDLQAECFEMLLSRGTSFHNNQVSGKLVSDAMDYPNAYNQIATMIVVNLAPFILTLLSGVLLTTYHSPILGALILTMTTLVLVSGIRFRTKMRPLRKKRIQTVKELTSHFADTLVNVQAVKTFAHEEEEKQEHAARGKKLLDYRLHDWLMFATNGSNRIAGLLLFQFAFICATIYFVRRDPTLLAAGIFAFSYTVTLSNRLFEIGNIIRTTEEALMQAEPITVALGQSPEVIDAADASVLKAKKGGVTFEDIQFHYDDSNGKDLVFDGLNLAIAPGEKVGLVGPSGGGKSTITRLLLRFEDVQAGRVCIDDQDVKSVTQASLRSAVAYVPQESLLFHRTIGENIAYGQLGATKEQIEQAARDAYAHDFILSLPDGYDTIVGERGVKLSGGQRQRIAIARAVLKDAPILLLDEATSALDSESEKVIQAALAELMKKRTAVVIAHRLSTIQKMDRIVVLDKGKIVEDGTHTHLLAKKGLYAKLWAHQSGGFIED